MKPFVRLLLVVASLIVGLVMLWYLGVHQWFSFEHIRAHRSYFQDLVAHHYGFSLFLYIGLYALIVTSALPIAGVLTILSGFLYGSVLGALYSWIGFMIGAISSFLGIRYLMGDFFKHRYMGQLSRFQENMEKYGTSYLLMLYFFTVVPAFVMTLLAAMSTMSLRRFALITAVGIIPGSFVYAFAGQELGSLQSAGEVFKPRMLAALGILVVLALAPMVVRRIKTRMHGAD